MNDIEPLDADSLAKFLARYDVGEPVAWRAVSHGIENSNYFVSTSAADAARAEWVLTVLEQPSNAGSAYVPLLDLCHLAGLPVARVVRTSAGGALQTLRGKTAMLAPRLPGAHIEQPTVAQVRQLGCFIGDFHRATVDPGFAVPRYPRDQRWLRDRASATGGLLPNSEQRLVRECVDRVTIMLDHRDIGELPTGVVHGDLFRDNLLFEGAELTGVLDFHHASFGYLVYDLAVAANDWCGAPDGALDRERAAALVTAYHRQRPLTKLEQHLFPGFLLYAGLAFWLSRLVVALRVDAAPPSRYKDPNEFKAIVAHRHTDALSINFL